MRLLLLLFPRAFREEYGEEWLAAAEERRRLFLSDGRPCPRLRFLRFLFRDALHSVPNLWLRRTPVESRGRDSAAPPSPLSTPRTPKMETLIQDLGFGVRTLRKRPLFAGIAIVTLALGIGSATAVFSVVEGVLLRPPPFESPEELVSVWKTYPGWRSEPMLAAGWNWGVHSYPGYERWRGGQTHFQDVAIHGSTFRNFTGHGNPERIAVGIASSSLFGVLDVQAALGRTFLPEEDQEGSTPVAILSHAFWQERFGGDEGVLGSSIHLDQTAFTVVGILPAGFRLRSLGIFGVGGDLPVWIPVGVDGYRRSETSHSYEAIGRLAPGATIEQARAEALSLIPTPGDPDEVGVRMEPWVKLERAGLRPPLLLLLGASGILLLIACGNVATLLLGEFTGRQHEMATRAAIGAGRWRLIRQVMTESALLGFGGSLLGIALALADTRLLITLAPPLPRLDEVSVNPTVLLFGAGLGILTGLIFGVAPAFHLTGAGGPQRLSRGRDTGSRQRVLLQQGVIATELALTLVLLVTGTLLARSLGELMAVDTGFRQDRLAMVRAYLPRYRYTEPGVLADRVETMRQALSAVPGVTAVSGTSSLPFYDGANALSYGIEGRPMPEGVSPHATLKAVLPDFFETMGIRILEGRPLLSTDRPDGPRVTVISETLARRHWGGESALGARILFGDTLEVVGVAADVIHDALDAEPRATLYVPFLSAPSTSISFLVRTAGDPEPLFPILRQAVWSVDQETPIIRSETLVSLISNSARSERFRAVLMLVFATSAILLAGAGVFGVTARAVAHRTKELGIRRALGASSRRLVRLGLEGTAGAGLVGLVLGLIGSLIASRALRGFLFEIRPWDPATYWLATCFLLAMGLVAAWLPARRAGRVEPMDVLREDR